MQVGSDVALVKTTRSEDARDEAELTKGEVVTVLSLNGEWARVRTEDGKLGWMRGADLQKAKGNDLDQGAVGKAIQVKLPGDILMKFGYCPPGSFMMGSPASENGRGADEEQVQVRISKGFWMGQYEVTQGQWAAVMGTTVDQQAADGERNLKLRGVGADFPMYYVYWEQAQVFIEKLNQSGALPAGWKFALPTEAQWEYACRAGTETPFHFGSVLDGRDANCDGNYPYGTTEKGPSLNKAVKVGSYGANAWGLYDMHGNVEEFCEDAWDGIAKLPGGIDPLGTVGSYRVIRGGGTGLNGAANCRAAARFKVPPNLYSAALGFRVAAIPAGAR